MRPFRHPRIFALLAIPLTAVGLLAVEAYLVAHREYAEVPDFDVRFTTGGCKPALRMAVLGDSTVAGLGASSAETTLPGHLARKVAASTGRSVSLQGFGVSGAVTRDVVQEQLEMVGKGDVDVLVIEIGSNDVTHLTSLADLERDTREMLSRARELAPVVVLGSGGRLNSPNFLPPLRQLVMARATSVRRRQAKVAGDMDVPIVDVAREVSPTYDRTPGANSSDLFHPSDVGYEIWARPLAQRVIEGLDAENLSCVKTGAGG